MEDEEYAETDRIAKNLDLIESNIIKVKKISEKLGGEKDTPFIRKNLQQTRDQTFRFLKTTEQLLNKKFKDNNQRVQLNQQFVEHSKIWEEVNDHSFKRETETLMRMELEKRPAAIETPPRPPSSESTEEELLAEVRNEKIKLKLDVSKNIAPAPTNSELFAKLSVPFEQRKSWWISTRSIWHKAHPVLGGWLWWRNLKEDNEMILQEHKTGLWPHTYRILLKGAVLHCIAHGSNKTQMVEAWGLMDAYQPYLEKLNIYHGGVLDKFFKVLEGQLEENPDRVVELVAGEVTKKK